MRARLLPLLVLVAAPAVTAAPTTMLYAGTLEGPSGPVGEPVSAVFTLFDDADAGSALFTQTESALEVVEGALVVELGSAGDLDDAALGDRALFLEVSVNGNTLSPRARIDAHPVAHFAHHVASAPLAHDTDAVGGLSAAEAVSYAELAAAGGPAVAYGNLAGFPAAFADGDQGLDFTPSNQFSFSGGTLSLANGSIGSAEIQDGAVGTSELAAGAVTSAAIASGAVDSSKLAAGAVWDSNIANASLTTRVLGVSGATNQRRVYKIDTSACTEEMGTLTFDVACTPGRGGCSIGWAMNCVGNCVNLFGGSAPSCPNTAVGWVVYAP